MTTVPIETLIVSDEAGFACSKTKLVECGLPHLRPFNISDDGSLDLTQIYQIPASEAPEGKNKLITGDILFNNTNSAELVGKSAVVSQTMMAGFSNHLTRIRVNQSRVDPVWFGFWLRQLRSTGYFTANATQWVSQAAYRTSDLRKLVLELPTMDEQRRISDLLSRAEGIVRLRREAQKKAAAIIPALFLDMFGDPATNPKGWPMVQLSDVIRSADYGSSTKASSDGQGIPLVRMGNVDYAGDIDLSDLKYVELDPSEAKQYRLVNGDLLFNRTNSKELVGKTGLWEGAIEAVAASYFIRVRVDEGHVRPFFVWAFMNTQHMKRVLFDTARGAIGQANINARELRAFRVPLPDLQTQARFEEGSRALLSIRKQQATAVEVAAKMFNSLLAKMLSGEKVARSGQNAAGTETLVS